MSKIYARVVDGVVAEMMPLADGMAIEKAVHASLLPQMVDATNVAGVAQGWTYAHGVFSAPAGPTLNDLRARAIFALRASASAWMTGGFTSDALGVVHTYPSQNTPDHPDQQNLAASVLASLMPGLAADWTTPFWCAVNPAEPTSWTLIPHTASQIQKVGLDLKTFIIAAQNKLNNLVATVNAATTSADINAVTW